MSAQTLLHIRVIEGEGAVHGSESKCSRPIVVEVTDETGRPVEGAAISFRMPEEGPGATFERGMRTDIRVTTPDGRAAAYECQTGKLTGPFQVRVTAVKSQIRAGTVVAQYVSDAPVKSRGATTMVRRSGSGRKWLLIAAIAGGAAAAGLTVGMGRGGATSSAPAAPPTPPQIGAPTISIGGPQ